MASILTDGQKQVIKDSAALLRYLVSVIEEPEDKGNVSDGYHTFNELYHHRAMLMCALMRAYKDRLPVWWSEYHHDGSRFEGFIIVGIGKEPGRQITYHVEEDGWELFDFAEHLDRAPYFDGHTPEEVIDRLEYMHQWVK